MKGQALWRNVVAAMLIACCTAAASGQGDALTPPAAVGPTERIALTQLKNSLEVADADELLVQFPELLDRGGRKLIAFETAGQGSGRFTTYWPLSTYLPNHLRDALRDAPELRRSYQASEDRLARVAIARALETDDYALARANADRFVATSHGDDALLALAELATRRGWFQASRAALQRLGAPWVIVGTDATGERPPMPLPWTAFPTLPPEELAAAATRRGDQPLPRTPIAVDVDRQQVTHGLVASLVFSGRESAAQHARDVAEAAGLLEDAARSRLASLLPSNDTSIDDAVAATRIAAPSFAYAWSTPLASPPERTDFAEPNELPVGRTTRPSLGQPIASGNTLLLHTATSLRGYDLASGNSWPLPERDRPFFDSGYRLEELLFGPEVQIYGRHCFRPVQEGRLLFARFGPEVTGWIPQNDPDPYSLSQQLVFDLQRDGSLLEGYPLDPPRDDEAVWEWEGPPAVVGDVAVASLLSRGPTGMRNKLVAWRVSTAEILWRSPVVAEAPAAVHDAHRSSCAIPRIESETVYHCSSLGNVVALDLNDGRILWTTTYPRRELAASRYRHRRRAAFRHSIQPLTIEGIVVIAAADCDRLFALDADTGRLRWSTAPGVAADAMHLIEGGDQLLASGDALYAIDKQSGRVESVYPALPTTTPATALPSPRAVGSPAIDDRFLYWPTATSVLVFPIAAGSQPLLPATILDLEATGTPSGDLNVFGDKLVIRSGEQLTVFQIHRQD